ncbi:hypothetical protein B0H21DRAFT_103092 [Amylocystis lapponica]|nr:hypothetical protein B0H21DRAFT_103092 [Amylocystis lapponica]
MEEWMAATRSSSYDNGCEHISEMWDRNPSLSLPVVATPSTAIVPFQGQGNRLAIFWLRRRWIILSVVLVAAIIGCSIGVGWAFRLHKFNMTDGQPAEGNVVSLTATLIAIDPVGQTMMMDWFATYPCESSRPTQVIVQTSTYSLTRHLCEQVRHQAVVQFQAIHYQALRFFSTRPTTS